MNFIKVTQIIAVSIAFCSFSFGQVGVNTENPDPKSAMDVRSPSGSNRGVLLPRMTQVQMDSISVSPGTPEGLMVFNTTDRLFYYYDGSKWIGLVPKQPITNLSNGSVNMDGNIILDTGSVVATNITSTDATINGNISVNGFAQNALVPTGAIMMWSGDPNALPAGWGLCNGNYYWTNGPALGAISPPLPPYFLGFQLIPSPDLRGRFIVGYDAGAPASPYIATNNGTDINYGSVGNLGGENGHLLTSGESGLPTHNHSATLTGNTTSSGEHTHSVRKGGGTAGGGFDIGAYDNDGWYATGLPDGGHGHSVSVSGNTNTNITQNATDVHENRPPYYVLAYIIKLP